MRPTKVRVAGRGITLVQFCSSGLLSPIELVHMGNHSQSPRRITWSCTHFLSDILHFLFGDS